MKPTFHEDFSRGEEVKSGTDRSFGLTVGGILVVIAAARSYFHGLGWVQYGLAAIGVVLILLGLVAPQSLTSLHRAWDKLGLILFRVVNPVVLALIYGIVMVPVGLLMRLTGRDPLRLKSDAGAESYWIVRDRPGPAPETMINQF
jgi:hypothetical protein